METICTICGGTYEYKNGKWICAYCGYPKPEELSNEEVTLLHQAGQKLRLQDFEEAEILFTDIIQKYPQNPEGYWGLVCAKYGIKYEEDYDGKKIPTCCLDTIPNFEEDNDYLKALAFSKGDLQNWYRSQAAYVDRVSKQWNEDASKEKPYDIFICFKDSDRANGIERTQDSYDAMEIYTQLQEKGYRVFMSRISLQDKTGEKYEPYIFNALQTAKVMLVFGSSVEYITSTWLQNEWKRYLKRMANGEKKKNSLVVAYKNLDPSDLPFPLKRTQCLNFNSNDFYLLLLEYLQSFIQRESDATPTQEKKRGFFEADEGIESVPLKTKLSQPIPTQGLQYKRDGNYIYFGIYPQSEVTDAGIITQLNALGGAKPTNGNNNGWTSYKYYQGNGYTGSQSNATDFMWYIDQVYNGNKYRGVYFTSYRPSRTTNSSSADSSCQDYNGYTTSTIYWFQYEPIKWRILEESDGYATILAELILDSQTYQNEKEHKNSGYYIKGTNTYANNYAESTIRKWLNDTFYNTAFSSMQQALIQTVTVDNGARSTTPDVKPSDYEDRWKSGDNEYACSNTNEKIWLLSTQEVTKASYGFKTAPGNYDTLRRKTTSDYARCQGADTSTSTDYNGKGWWWLRSPYCGSSTDARLVHIPGYVDSYNNVYGTHFGVVPALVIRLS